MQGTLKVEQGAQEQRIRVAGTFDTGAAQKVGSVLQYLAGPCAVDFSLAADVQLSALEALAGTVVDSGRRDVALRGLRQRHVQVLERIGYHVVAGGSLEPGRR